MFHYVYETHLNEKLLLFGNYKAEMCHFEWNNFILYLLYRKKKINKTRHTNVPISFEQKTQ